eukprot:SAG11_NODE_27592_length_331_cov_0.663793_1_plen_66_part_10
MRERNEVQPHVGSQLEYVRREQAAAALRRRAARAGGDGAHARSGGAVDERKGESECECPSWSSEVA